MSGFANILSLQSFEILIHNNSLSKVCNMTTGTNVPEFLIETVIKGTNLQSLNSVLNLNIKVFYHKVYQTYCNTSQKAQVFGNASTRKVHILHKIYIS